MPGVQIPHCAAPCSWNARCSRLRPPFPASPSTVVTERPRTWPIGTRQEQTCSPSSSTVQAPQSPASQPTLVPVRSQMLAEHAREPGGGRRVDLDRPPVDVKTVRSGHAPAGRERIRSGPRARSSSRAFGAGRRIRRLAFRVFGTGWLTRRPASRVFGAARRIWSLALCFFGSARCIKPPASRLFGAGQRIQRPAHPGPARRCRRYEAEARTSSMGERDVKSSSRTMSGASAAGTP